MPSINALSVEEILRIIKYLPQRDLASFARTCSGIHQTANHLLYKTADDKQKDRLVVDAIRDGNIRPLRTLVEAGNQLPQRLYTWSSSLQQQEDARLLDAWADGLLPTLTLRSHYELRYDPWMFLLEVYTMEFISTYFGMTFEHTKICWEDLEFLREFRHLPDAFGPEIIDYNTPPSTWTPLHLAAALGRDEIVNLLLDNGADINAGSRGLCKCREIPPVGQENESATPSWTPLHVAMCWEHRQTAEILLSRGASACLDAGSVGRFERARALGRQGATGGVCTALHMACLHRQADLVQMIVRGKHQDIAACDSYGHTPLAYAFLSGDYSDTIPFLVQNGADINDSLSVGRHRGPLLYIACLVGKYSDAYELLELGADAEYCDGDASRLTLLHLCARGVPEYARPEHMNHQTVTAKILLRAGADVEAVRGCGETPLMVAARSGDLGMARLLLEHGANVSARSADGSTVLMHACNWSPDFPGFGDNGHIHGMEANLEERPVDEMVQLLVAHGADVNATDPHGDTALIHALRLPGRRNAMLNYQIDDRIYEQMYNQMVDTVRWLVDLGADVVKRDRRGRFPFQIVFLRRWYPFPLMDMCESLFHPKLMEEITDQELKEMVVYDITRDRYRYVPENVSVAFDAWNYILSAHD